MWRAGDTKQDREVSTMILPVESYGYSRSGLICEEMSVT